ncbi:MAG: choline-sulfatase [Planctomycetota bacterium]|jgi:choline-sulfatase
MSQTLISRWIASALLACMLVGAARASAEAMTQGLPADKPLNVLFIISDQHNVRSMSCTDNGYGGVTAPLTPGLDRLADRGVRFENAYCPTPQCMPTRYSLITGMWPHNHGLRINHIWEPRGIPTLPGLARDVGYATAIFGKHHYSSLDQTPLTDDLGFDEFLDSEDYTRYCSVNGQLHHRQAGNFWSMPGLPLGLGNSTGFTFNDNNYHPAGYWADQVIGFLQARAADERPFLCYYSMYGPHTPVLPSGPASPEDWAHRFHPYTALGLPPNIDKIPTTDRLLDSQSDWASLDDDEWREVLSYYYGLTNQIDANIERVLVQLNQLGLGDNTLVIYTADHGEMSAEMACWTKGAGMYDAISKVPMIVSLPGVLPQGAVRPELMNSLDLVQMMFEMMGLPISDSDRSRLDGRSVLDVALGNTPANWRQTLFAEFGTSNTPIPTSMRMARNAQFKYCYDEIAGGQEELYDLLNDEFEITNLIASNDVQIQNEITSLKDQLDFWWDNEIGHAPDYLRSGDADEPPHVTEQPFPASGSTAVARDVDLAWLPSTAAVSQRVYIGPSAQELRLWRVLDSLEAAVNLGTLNPGQTLFWRVDQINANGTTAGIPFSFTTETTPYFAAALALSPTPAHRATEKSLKIDLQWIAGKAAVTQELYFGPTGTLTHLATLDSRTERFAAPRLQAGVSYEWRVDSVHPQSTTAGDVWTFATARTGLPSRTIAIQPLHLDEHANLSAGIGLRWRGAGNATSYDVYLGESHPLPLQSNQTALSFDPGALSPNTTYYWRIDSRNERGVSTGFAWRFSTAP